MIDSNQFPSRGFPQQSGDCTRGSGPGVRGGQALLGRVAAESFAPDGTALHAFVLDLVHREMGDIARSKQYGRLALQHARERGAAEQEDQIRFQRSP